MTGTKYDRAQVLLLNILIWRESIPPVNRTRRCLRLVHRQSPRLTHHLPLTFPPRHAPDSPILCVAIGAN